LFKSESYQKLLDDISKLQRVDENWVVSDFDDTLYSRSEQLQNPILAKNR
jgi:hypothetical protein